jgi:DNA-binding transcriptional ArsR family regulator
VNEGSELMQVIDGKPLSDEELARTDGYRLRILAALSGGRDYVSRLAREIGMSRPLLHMHLQRLEAAGLVTGRLKLSEDGKAMKYFEVSPFALHLTPTLIAEAARTLSDVGGERT